MKSLSVSAFTEALNDSTERLTDLSDRGTRMLGYFCTYTPVEFIHAAGFLPVRITGGTCDAAEADNLTPNFICPYMRQALSKALRGEYRFLSGVVQAYTCDVACGLVRIWENHIAGGLFHTIPLPYNDSTDSRRYFAAALEELGAKLQHLGAPVTESALDQSLDLYSQMRGSVLDLYRMRYDGTFPLAAADFLHVVRAAFVMPPEDYLTAVNDLIEAARHAEVSATNGIPVLVSGSLIEEPRVLAILEESGGKVVADDLCTGFRHFFPADGQGSSPMDRLIDRYMNRFPCPARSRAEDRAARLAELIQRSAAKGVVFVLQKFCTPHLADHPTLVSMLKEWDMPTVMVEMEEAAINEGQLRTRLEAFFEMLGE